MNTRLLAATALVVAANLSSSATAEACSCGGTISSPEAFRHSAVVFLGRVDTVSTPAWQVRETRNADGSTSVVATPPGRPTLVTFDLQEVFRGSVKGQATLESGNSTCDFPFAASEVWLIYAVEEHGALRTDKCLRTRRLIEASEDLKYLAGLRDRRAQAVLSGTVFQHVTTADGNPANGALPETLDVVAVGAGESFRTKTDRWGPYEFVLPPGLFEVWAERNGQRVTYVALVHVGNGDEQTLTLTADLR
jgi:hypothetical protein